MKDMEAKDWINRNDKMPEIGQDVLVFQSNTRSVLMSVYTGNGFKVQKYPGEGDRSMVDYWAHVTHWMPLPEPPLTGTEI